MRNMMILIIRVVNVKKPKYIDSTIFLHMSHLHNNVSRQFDLQNGVVQPDDIGCVLGVEICLVVKGLVLRTDISLFSTFL